jgi:hypothetical protein
LIVTSGAIAFTGGGLKSGGGGGGGVSFFTSSVVTTALMFSWMRVVRRPVKPRYNAKIAPLVNAAAATIPSARFFFNGFP